MGINNFTSFSQLSATEFSVVDTTGITHSINITRTDGKIDSVIYDGVEVSLGYSENNLVTFDEGDITLTESENPGGNIGYMANFYIGNTVKYNASCLTEDGEISAPPQLHTDAAHWITKPLILADAFTSFPDTVVGDINYSGVNENGAFYDGEQSVGYFGSTGSAETLIKINSDKVIIGSKGTIRAGNYISPFIIIISPSENLSLKCGSSEQQIIPLAYNEENWFIGFATGPNDQSTNIYGQYSFLFPALENSLSSIPNENDKKDLAKQIINSYLFL